MSVIGLVVINPSADNSQARNQSRLDPLPLAFFHPQSRQVDLRSFGLETGQTNVVNTTGKSGLDVCPDARADREASHSGNLESAQHVNDRPERNVIVRIDEYHLVLSDLFSSRREATPQSPQVALSPYRRRSPVCRACIWSQFRPS
jgi:hypothetical protein